MVRIDKAKIFNIAILILVINTIISCKPSHKSLYNNTYLTSDNWIVEQQPGGKVEFSNYVMEITDSAGCTVWFKHKLQAPVRIEYDATVIDNSGPFDRVSDLNCFWMSNDPKSPDDFFKNSDKREGKFTNYHELAQYYVGYGGHNNSKTRFRRYDGNIDRPLLPEHDLSGEKFMIVPNKTIHITLSVDNNIVGYKRDGETIFEITDKEPYLNGYFGIRTVNNHMKIENLKIVNLK